MVKRTPHDAGVIDLTSDTEEAGAAAAAAAVVTASAKKKRRHQRVKQERTAEEKGNASANATELYDNDNNDSNDDRKPSAAARSVDSMQDVEIVQAPALQQVPIAAAAAQDDIQVVGTLNHVRLPHMRQHCTEQPFCSTSQTAIRPAARDAKNRLSCNQCYCYVCDVMVAECKQWRFHCNANDAGPTAGHWKAMRQTLKTTLQQATATAVTASAAARERLVQERAQNDITNDHTNNNNNNNNTLAGTGPFEPTNALAAADTTLTACRHCKWFNKFCHQNFSYDARVPLGGTINNRRKPKWYRGAGCTDEIYPPASPLDWCHACGRVATERDLSKAQSRTYTPNTHAKPLGTVTVHFTLHTHDPRHMLKYQERWQEQQDEWTYDESAQRNELFAHRLGEKPLLEIIVHSLPVSTVDHIPTDGRHPSERHGDPEELQLASVSETQAVLLDDPEDAIVLQELLSAAPSFGLTDTEIDETLVNVKYLDGDIRAEWDNHTNKGKFTIRTFVTLKVPRPAMETKMMMPPRELPPPTNLTEFLAAWFGVLPFALHDVCGLIGADADSINMSNLGNWRNQLESPLPPFTALAEEGLQVVVDQVMEEANEKADAHNEMVEERASNYFLEPGSGCSVLGGLCTNENDFVGTMKRYVREVFPDIVMNHSRYSREQELAFGGLNVASRHRAVRRNQKWIALAAGCGDVYPPTRDEAPLGKKFASFLSHKDYAFSINALKSDAEVIHNKTQSLTGLMDHMENLGHAAAEFVEGLTIELLPFQSQTLEWAKEREQTPGGINSFLWPKLPLGNASDAELYFNPILGQLTDTKPPLSRGGIIAEQMGLGKTVISLALILRNPAPVAPVSGSAITEIFATPNVTSGAAFWDPDLYARMSERKKKRGSIISRGTLVVCNVSLVGQWMEEAKSKLKNPGLVYSYHGQGRKRDPHLLAQNSIVVTTYETLASDATLHAARSGEGSDYTAPCEQVRWWRVICDESHSIRNKGSKATAIMELAADNKWLVSGTPVNTSLMDLDEQLSFLGVEKARPMINLLKKSTFRHIGDRNVSRGGGGRRRRQSYDFNLSEMPKLGNFLFLMRPLMMRHSQKQKYRATDTTLMSLPPKTHQTIFVDFDETDRKEYDALEATAKGYYRSMKAQNKGVHLSRHFLKLTHMLKPMRIACAGGKIPLDEPKKAKEEIGSDGEDDMDEELEEGHKKKKEKQFSKHAFTSKLLTLVTELERIRTEEPNAKSLVFSQFGSTLTWLQGELPKHGFQFRTLSGDMSMKKRAKALADFQHDPPTTIFLLSMRAGAVGINLTQANRVFLMEPCFNPALEAQAIGRVYRLGQKHNVEIIRLIIKDSVESRMITMLEEKFGANTYGNGDAANTADDDDDDDSVDDGDKKPKAVATSAPVLVGSLTTDRAAVVAEEFDLLYGLDPAEEGEQEANQDPGVGLANMFGLALGSGGGSGDDDDLSVADI